MIYYAYQRRGRAGQRSINTRCATLLKFLKFESILKNSLTGCSHHLPLTVTSKKVAQKLFQFFSQECSRKIQLSASLIASRPANSHPPCYSSNTEHAMAISAHHHTMPIGSTVYHPAAPHCSPRSSWSSPLFPSMFRLIVASPSSPAVGFDLLSPSLGGYNIDVSARWLAINYLHPCQ